MNDVDRGIAIAASLEKARGEREVLQEQLEHLDKWIEWLEQGVEIARSLPAPEAPAIEAPAAPVPVKPAPDPEPEPPEEPVKPPPVAEKKKPAKRHTAATPERAAKAKSREAGKQTREGLLAAIREEPGLSQAELAEKIGKDQSTVSQSLKALSRQGRRGVRVERDGRRKRYFPAESDIAPPDQTGARTGPERELCEVLKGKGLTAREVALNTGRPHEQVSTMLEALRRRGALERTGTPAVYTLQGEGGDQELPEAA